MIVVRGQCVEPMVKISQKILRLVETIVRRLSQRKKIEIIVFPRRYTLNKQFLLKREKGAA